MNVSRDRSFITAQGESAWKKLCENYPRSEYLIAYQDSIKKAFSLSDFIARVSLAYPEALLAVCGGTESQYNQDQLASISLASNEDSLYAAVRAYRHGAMMAIAWSDIIMQQPIQTSLQQVSDIADQCVSATYQWLYIRCAQKYGFPQQRQHMFILGMGKLGGRELNFSSDIDLIFVYPEKGHTDRANSPIEHHVFFTRLAQQLISALDKTTVNGQAYRVDMRLRPLGESGPLVLNMSAFAQYYQDHGRDWERFAMLKARVINRIDGTKEECKIFSNSIALIDQIIKPFVFRRYLDFTTIESLRQMKSLISQEYKRKKLSNNIKLGPGGIREIEFFIQSLQIIHAGKHVNCQFSSIFLAANALVESGFLALQDKKKLIAAYCFLRKVEHSLQQLNDQQTQTLPDDESEWQKLIYILAFSSIDVFKQQLMQHMAYVHGLFNDLIEPEQKPLSTASSQAIYQDLWQVELSEEDAFYQVKEDKVNISIDTIKQLILFKDAYKKIPIGERGYLTLNKLMPLMLQDIVASDSHQQSVLTARILSLLLPLLGRTTYLDLLLENPDVRTRLLTLCNASEWITKQITNYPLLLDELLHPVYLNSENSLTTIGDCTIDMMQSLNRSMLRIEIDDVESQMSGLRQFKHSQQLRVAAADVCGSMPIEQVSDRLTILAEVILEYGLNIAWHHIANKFGTPPNTTINDKGVAIIAYGKLGGFELGYGSDLDLVFIHNAQDGQTTNGERSISSSHFYVKLVQRLVHLLSTRTIFGALYEIDLRLRPSGNSGLLVSSVSAFENYQQHNAWTWEHQALIKARYITGSEVIKALFDKIRRKTLTQKRSLDTLKQEVSEMRLKMRHHLLKSASSKIDLKQQAGGIADIEFLVQFWVLSNAHEHPSLIEWNDNLRILTSICEAGIIPPDTMRLLQNAYLHYRLNTHRLALNNQTLVKASGLLTAQLQQIIDVWDDNFH